MASAEIPIVAGPSSSETSESPNVEEAVLSVAEDQNAESNVPEAAAGPIRTSRGGRERPTPYNRSNEDKQFVNMITSMGENAFLETRKMRDLRMNRTYVFQQLASIDTRFGKGLVATVHLAADEQRFKVFLPGRFNAQLNNTTSISRFLRLFYGFEIKGFSRHGSPELEFIRHLNPRNNNSDVEDDEEPLRNICRVCFDRVLDRVLNCGHTLCSECADKISSCHICREVITSRSPFFT